MGAHWFVQTYPTGPEWTWTPSLQNCASSPPRFDPPRLSSLQRLFESFHNFPPCSPPNREYSTRPNPPAAAPPSNAPKAEFSVSSLARPTKNPVVPPMTIAFIIAFAGPTIGASTTLLAGSIQGDVKFYKRGCRVKTLLLRREVMFFGHPAPLATPPRFRSACSQHHRTFAGSFQSVLSGLMRH